jgi:NitT/TauT family transport system substrate-binding protein
MRKLLALLFLAALVQTPASAKDVIRFNLALAPAGPNAPLFFAMEKGWYDQQNLDVQIDLSRGSMGAVQYVASGQADLGQGELGPMAVAIDKGAPLISIAGWGRKPEIAIFVDRDGPIKTPQDLKGHTVGLLANSPWTPLIDSFFKKVGMTRDDVQLVVIDPASLFSSYATHRVDTMMTIGPYVMPIVDPARPTRLLNAVDYGIVSPGEGVEVARSTLAAKKDALTRFIKLQIRAWNYILAGHQEEGVAAIIAQNPDARLNPRILLGQIDEYQKYFYTDATKGHPIGWQAAADWQAAIDSFQDAGVFKNPHKPSDFYTNELIDSP